MCADIYNCLSYDIITSAKDAMFLPVSFCLSFGLLVCQQDYTKAFERISMKLG